MKITMNRTAYYAVAWLAAVSLAVGLAFVFPNEAKVMGQLPAFVSQTLTRKPVALPEGLPSDRTLALITFKREHRAQADSWVEGLNLKNDPSITWVRIPVLNDPGTAGERTAAESRLLERYTADVDRAKIVPVFTDRSDFVRAVGLNGTDKSYAVVVNRAGEVLARVEGPFDADKAKILRETLDPSRK